MVIIYGRADTTWRFPERYISNNDEILNSTIAILPGVGAFGEAMNQIKALRLDKTIKEFINTGKQFVGISLGLQLLFENSEEF